MTLRLLLILRFKNSVSFSFQRFVHYNYTYDVFRHTGRLFRDIESRKYLMQMHALSRIAYTGEQMWCHKMSKDATYDVVIKALKQRLTLLIYLQRWMWKSIEDES